MTEYAKDLCALGKTGETALQASLNRQLDLVEGALGSPVPFIGVHPECTLLIHHHRESEVQPRKATFIPPLRYIAVSKLSCFCCWCTYKEYSKATNRTFLLRGSHSKLYSPWWAATDHFGDDRVAVAVRRGLYSRLVKLYSEYLDRLGDSHNRLSDSTAASNESGRDDRMTADDTDEVEVKEEAMIWADTTE